MKLKKVLIGMIVICIVVAIVAFYILCHKGWEWHLPQTLLDRIDFNQIGENIDQMIADGYTEVYGHKNEDNEPTYYILGRADNENATPMIYVVWTNSNNLAETDAIQYDADTMFYTNLGYTVGNKDQYRFRQEITIQQGDKKIWMVYYTKNLFAGRQQVIDYLTQFCDDYCPD